MITLGKSKANCSWHVFTVSILEVLNNFMKNLFITESSDFIRTLLQPWKAELDNAIRNYNLRCLNKHAPHASPRNNPRQLRNGVVCCCCCTLFAASAYHSYDARGDGSAKCVFCLWWRWPLTFDLDIQTHPREGPNTSSLQVWRKPFRVPETVHTQTKNKQNEKCYRRR